MLNGIGGNTIADAMQKLTLKELDIWQRYIISRGTLNIGRRIENHVGHSNYLYASVNCKGKQKLENFMPHEYAIETYEELSDFDRLAKRFGQ